MIIIGGGPAGLSAGLWLGRCLRNAIIFDHGRPRNAASHGVHGFFTRDNAKPSELISLGREQLKPYGVEVVEAEVRTVRKLKGGFKVTLNDGNVHLSRRILLASGVTDELPLIKGATEIYGKSMHHCPYCDGWEWRDKRIAVYAHGKTALVLSEKLQNWTKDVVLISDGPSKLGKKERSTLASRNIPIYEQKIDRLEHQDGMLQRIVMANGERIEREAIFFANGQHQRSQIGVTLGCKFSSKGTILASRHEETNIEGVFVAGDASRDMQFVIVAAAEGTKAAIAIHESLLEEDGTI